MVRNSMGFFTIAILIVLGYASVPASAQGDPIGAVDNIPPQAPSNIAVVPELGVDPNVTVSWDLSPSDALAFTSTNGGSGSVVTGNDVVSYIIRVRQFGAEEEVEIARVAPGLTTYTDGSVELGLTYEYDNIFYNEIITITSDDPLNSSVGVTVKGLGKLAGEGVKPVTRKIVKARVIFPISLDFTDLDAVVDCALNATANIQASLAAGFLVINVRFRGRGLGLEPESISKTSSSWPMASVVPSTARSSMSWT